MRISCELVNAGSTRKAKSVKTCTQAASTSSLVESAVCGGCSQSSNGICRQHVE